MQRYNYSHNVNIFPKKALYFLNLKIFEIYISNNMVVAKYFLKSA
jgi:hypothetical protein